ncbi:MAG: hypothetical protein ACRENE_17480 [Polyangiaceae bacterium]
MLDTPHDCYHRGVRAAVLLVALLLLPVSASAQEIQPTGPLRAAPDLLRRRLSREGRFALTSIAGAALASGNSTAAVVGGEVLFHPVDEIGVGVWSVAALSLPAARRDSEGLQSAVAPELVLVPVKGRPPTLFGSIWLPAYDVHLVVGGAWVEVQSGGVGLLRPMAGVGFTSFFASFMSFGVDYRVLGDAAGGVVTASLAYWPGVRRDDERYLQRD